MSAERTLFDPADIPARLRDCFEEVETQCGAGWVRVVEREGGGATQGHRPDPRMACVTGKADGSNTRGMPFRAVKSESWRPGCSCPEAAPVPAVILDPFAGAGTVGLVARRLGRDFIGLELNPEYAAMADERIAREWCESMPFALPEQDEESDQMRMFP